MAKLLVFLLICQTSIKSIVVKQTKAHSAIDNPANLHRTIEQSPVPLNIMGKASASGKVSTTNPRSAPQSNISGGLCSSHTCLMATPAPSPAKSMINQLRADANIFIGEIIREIRAKIPIRTNAYL